MLKILNRIFKTIKISYQGSKLFFILINIMSLIYGISFGFIAKNSERFFADIIKYVNGEREFIFIKYSLIIFLATVTINYFLNGLMNNLFEILASKATIQAKLDFQDNIFKKDLINYEKNSFLDRLDSVDRATFMLGYVAIISMGIIATTLPSIIAISKTYYSFNKILSLIIFILLIPNIVAVFKKFALTEKMKEELSNKERTMKNNMKMLIDREFYKEVRQLSAVSFLKEIYISSRDVFSEVKIKLLKRQTKVDLKVKLIDLICYLGVLILIIILFLKGNISVSEFSAIILTLGSFMTILREMFFNEFGVIIDCYSDLSIYFDFIDEKIIEKKNYTIKQAPTIEFKNVSFSYKDQPIINNISFKINSSEKVAIVGENGAGKTTLSKLITGQYKPTKGQVLIDGKDTREYNFDSGISAIFQDIITYAMTTKENITISSPEYNEDRYNDITSLYIEKGEELFEEEILTREFGDRDLSKGQAQKLSVMRGFYPESYLMVLDEPMASIDPNKEKLLIERIYEGLGDKTSIIITHRMSLAKKVDRIIVLEHGQIIEDNSFDKLMEFGNKFKHIFNQQAQWYE